MRQKQIVVTSPSYTLKVLKNFPLQNIEKSFVIADFERLVSTRHVSKIVSSMASNEFFDNVISVVQKRNGQYEIIDGQHRITALGLLRDNYGVKKYNLLLMIFQERISRKIYRQINLGQPLKMQDHLRALDNNKTPFFVKLRPYFVHYNDGRLPKFEMILNALAYAKNGSPRGVRPLLLDRMFESITEKDLKIIALFSKALQKADPFVPKHHQKLYMFTIYRNIFRVGYENNFDSEMWDELILLCKTDHTVTRLQSVRTMSSIREIYAHLIKKISKQTGVKLQTIERTNVEARKILNSSTTNSPSNAAV